MSREAAERIDVACAVSVSCQATALRNRTWASANSFCQGQAEAMANLMRRTLTRTRAPSFSSLRRMVPQVASANCVCAKPMRRQRAEQDVSHGSEPQAELVCTHGGG